MQPSIVLGPAVLGQEAFARQQRAAALDSGPIGLGPALAKPFVPAGPKVVTVVAPVEPAPVPKAVQPSTPAAPVVPPRAAKGRGKKAVVPTVVSFSETDVQVMLAKDPNSWPDVLEAEAQRPEGPRKLVAQLVLAAGDRASARPIPDEVLATMRDIVAS